MPAPSQPWGGEDPGRTEIGPWVSGPGWALAGTALFPRLRVLLPPSYPSPVSVDSATSLGLALGLGES